jgi:catechol 2,3-dioxygenase-like lactoylglutathione lyase family enzyme
MDVLSSRVLLHPTDPERSRVFYRDRLGLAIYREFGSGPDRGTVFFLGGGFLELSGHAAAPPAPGMALWLQVRQLAVVRRELGERGVPILREPRREPWGCWRCGLRTRTGSASASWRCRRSIPCAAAIDAQLGLLHGLPRWRVPFPGGPSRPAGGDDRWSCGC